MVPAWVCWVVEHWKIWAIRLTAVTSLALHILVLLLADVRRYNGACPVWTLLLWLAYQGLDSAGSYALGHLSLDDTGNDDAAAASEQLAVAFWAPFLLLHLGGPDNIGAYSLDDDKLGWRKAFGGLTKAGGALYVVFTKIWLADDDVGLLRIATMVMVFVGVCRFVENVVAQMRALRTKSTSGEKKKDTDMLRDSAAGNGELPSLEKIYEEAAKVYDKLYTKAGEVHSWRGYILRLLAPLATATAAILFHLYPKECMPPADVKITYALMSFALFLDVVWLVAALASASAKEFLEARPGFWFRHEILCSGWWDRLHRFSQILHPARLIGVGPSTYGSGFIGRYDLVRDCSRAPPGRIARLCSKVGSILFFRQDDAGWRDYRAWKSSSKLQPDVKEELFKGITARLEQSRATNNAESYYSRKDIRACWGQVAVRRRKINKLLDSFGSAFQEDILLWHIATTIFLCSDNLQQRIRGATNPAETMRRVKAIEAVSEYLMFLLAARPHMLPDPPLRSLYEVTQHALQDLYEEKKANDDGLCCASKKKQLANILLSSKEENFGDDNRRLIWCAAELASQLQNLDPLRPQDVVDLVFDVWVDKLLYAGINCNRESHARQLGKGGELVTIAWIAAEHVGVFQIGETGRGDDRPDPGPDPIDVIIKPPKCPRGEATNDIVKPPKCPRGEATNDILEPPKCPGGEASCHEGHLEPVCPHTCCMQEYCYCTQHYYYC